MTKKYKFETIRELTYELPNNQSLSKLGFTFKHPDYNDDSKEAESLLAGSYNFSTSEIEVYQVIQ